MTIGTQLRRAKLDTHYDTIVIGSGMGGLTSAVCLAKAGQKVLVLEKHYTAGGFTHTYSRKGFEWDVGLHYIGEVHRKNSAMRKIFDYISDENLHWNEMAPAYDRIILGNETFDYLKGAKAWKAKMIEYFPEEEKAISEYLSLLRQVTRASSTYFLDRALPQRISALAHKLLNRKFHYYSRQTTREVLQKLTRNEKLIAVLAGQWGDYGLPPEKSSFAMHAIVAKHYLSGANYPVGGSASIARTAEEALNKLGGQIVVAADVKSIVIGNGVAEGVELSDGRVLYAKNIVSAVGVINTFRGLMPDTCPEKQRYLKNLREIKPSMAHVCLYIGLKGDRKDFGLETSNLWIYPNEKFDETHRKFESQFNLDFSIIYISFPSMKDPDWQKNYPGKETVEIVVPIPYEWFEKWEDSRWRKRGEDYDQLKDEISKKLLEVLLKRVPQIKDSISYTELSTPLSTVHFAQYAKGEIYGIDHSPKRFDQRWLRADTRVKNLYLTGQDIVTCGVGGALVAGVLTAVRILGVFKGRKLLGMLT